MEDPIEMDDDWGYPHDWMETLHLVIQGADRSRPPSPR